MSIFTVLYGIKLSKEDVQRICNADLYSDATKTTTRDGLARLLKGEIHDAEIFITINDAGNPHVGRFECSCRQIGSGYSTTKEEFFLYSFTQIITEYTDMESFDTTEDDCYMKNALDWLNRRGITLTQEPTLWIIKDTKTQQEYSEHKKSMTANCTLMKQHSLRTMTKLISESDLDMDLIPYLNEFTLATQAIKLDAEHKEHPSGNFYCLELHFTNLKMDDL